MSESINVAVVGLGRVGLPLALVFAEHGCRVLGLEVDVARLAALSEGRLPFIEEGADELLARHFGRNFHPSGDPAVITQADVVILTFGTPVDEHMNPAYTQLEGVVEGLLPHFRAGQTLVLRSTVAPGTTKYLRRFIEGRTSLKVGTDFFLAFCPERIAEGRAIPEIGEIPQIVGALDPESGRRAAALFSRIAPQCLPADATAAELAKLFCNMYRYIDFAIGNEFMIIAMQHNANIYDIVDLVNRDYKRAGLKLPGLTGGPCLYKDGFFLVDRVPFADLISTAWKINETVPGFLIERIKRERDLPGLTAVILGLAFKRNIDDNRNSLAYKARKIFAAEGCRTVLHDPHLAPGDVEAVIRAGDIVFVAMNHDVYRDLGRARFRALLKDDAIVCDIWNLFGRGDIIYAKRDLPLE
ncbi:MAG: nucleotide sugar dehydrogenase [Deltaproteobacteria bacterium]|nr:nucleotide sugar dehydrogenase [Deltaproteobacteria bacterium]MBI3386271.1 nucleotide sugar dehydrogenase [Deltaproteobacteria bacterium]